MGHLLYFTITSIPFFDIGNDYIYITNGSLSLLKNNRCAWTFSLEFVRRNL